MPEALPRAILEPLVRAALLEDIGRGNDVTTDAILSAGVVATGRIVARKPGVVAGLDLARLAFTLLDAGASFDASVSDGERIEARAPAALVRCEARALLTAERTALNFLCRLSGIATATRMLADLAVGTKARIVDTRKTTPGLRVLERYAVRCGGGQNHRFGLDDGILIKDNHLALAGSMRSAVQAVRTRCGHMTKIEIEVDTIEQLREALALQTDAVLLDNMPPHRIREAVALANGRVLLESSGSVTPENVAEIASTGVDLISSGWITHSAPALDFGLDLEGAARE